MLHYTFNGLISCSYFTCCDCIGIAVNFICTLSQFWKSVIEMRSNCSCQLLLLLPPAPQPTYIHPCHHNHLAPIRACEWQPHSPAAPDSVVAASVPREPTAGGRSIEGALIITNHLPGREPWHIFITVVIKAISDYDQDIKPSRHLEQADYSTWWDLEWTQSFGRNFGRKFSRKHTPCSFVIHAVREFQPCQKRRPREIYCTFSSLDHRSWKCDFLHFDPDNKKKKRNKSELQFDFPDLSWGSHGGGKGT